MTRILPGSKYLLLVESSSSNLVADCTALAEDESLEVLLYYSGNSDMESLSCLAEQVKRSSKSTVVVLTNKEFVKEFSTSRAPRPHRPNQRLRDLLPGFEISSYSNEFETQMEFEKELFSKRQVYQPYSQMMYLFLQSQGTFQHN